MPKLKSLPDVASEASPGGELGPLALESVGMNGLAVPVSIFDSHGKVLRVPARVSAYVNLLPVESRGIHMSRLYSQVQAGLTGSTPLGFPLLKEIVQGFLKSHEELSDRAEISVEFESWVERAALKSPNSGWRNYPVRLIVRGKKQALPDEWEMWVETMVVYSSTCPASAALAHQLVQKNFSEQFLSHPPLTNSLNNEFLHDIFRWLGTSEGINATPHAQRSYAQLQVRVSQPEFSYTELIDRVEDILKTPVQAFVKREDEQEFALRNGQNLMFCEDAARRVQKLLEFWEVVLDYKGEFHHLESLHPHNAVAKIGKNPG